MMEILERLDIAMTKQILLVLFFVIFIGILLRLVLSRSNRYAESARIPLTDDEVVTPRGGNGHGRPNGVEGEGSHG